VEWSLVVESIYTSSLMFACWDAGSERSSVVFDTAAAFHRKDCLSVMRICTMYMAGVLASDDGLTHAVVRLVRLCSLSLPNDVV
jgi:hypothetical protein